MISIIPWITAAIGALIGFWATGGFKSGISLKTILGAVVGAVGGYWLGTWLISSPALASPAGQAAAAVPGSVGTGGAMSQDAAATLLDGYSTNGVSGISILGSGPIDLTNYDMISNPLLQGQSVMWTASTPFAYDIDASGTITTLADSGLSTAADGVGWSDAAIAGGTGLAASTLGTATGGASAAAAAGSTVAAGGAATVGGLGALAAGLASTAPALVAGAVAATVVPKALSSIPWYVWVGGGALVLFLLFGGKKKKDEQPGGGTESSPPSLAPSTSPPPTAAYTTSVGAKP
jgi:hypothetical protein